MAAATAPAPFADPVLIFNGKDINKFPMWKAKLRAVLTKRNVRDIIMGAAPEAPAEDATPAVIRDYKTWVGKNEQAFCLILERVEGAAFRVIYPYNDSQDGHAAWAALMSRYEGKSHARIRSLYKELSSAAMEKDEDIDDYYSRILMIRHNLEQLDQEPSEELFVSSFLSGLTEKFVDTVALIEPQELDLEATLVTLRTRQASLRAVKAAKAAELAMFMGKHVKEVPAQVFLTAHSKAQKHPSCDLCKTSDHTIKECTVFARLLNSYNGSAGSQPQQKQQQRNHNNGPNGQWCKVHNTSSHSDAQCFLQQRQGDTTGTQDARGRTNAHSQPSFPHRVNYTSSNETDPWLNHYINPQDPSLERGFQSDH